MPQGDTNLSIIRFQFSSRWTDEKQGSRISRLKIVEMSWLTIYNCFKCYLKC